MRRPIRRDYSATEAGKRVRQGKAPATSCKRSWKRLAKPTSDGSKVVNPPVTRLAMRARGQVRQAARRAGRRRHAKAGHIGSVVTAWRRHRACAMLAAVPGEIAAR